MGTGEAVAQATTPAMSGARRQRLSRAASAWAAVFALGVGALLLLPDPGPLPRLRLLAFDSYQIAAPRERQSQPAVIVAIDDRSLAAVGQWPWPRDTVARLVDRIAARRPAVIGLDIIFAEPDRTSPGRLAEQFRASEPELAQRLARLPSHESVLADSLGRAPVVLGVVGSPSPGGGVEGLAPGRMIGPPAPLLEFPGSERSLSEIDAAASGHGLFDAPLENGVVRRVPLVAMVGGLPLLSLPLECLRVAAGVPTFGVRTDMPDGLRVLVGDLAVPAQPDGSLFVHYSGHSPARFVSAVDVLEGREDPDLLAGRIALVGVTGQGLVDQQLIPNGERVPGVEVHAEVIENIFDESLLRRPRHARALEAFAFTLLAVFAIAWVPGLSPRRSTLVFLGGAVLLLGAAAGAYLWRRELYDPLTPLLGLALLHAALVLVTMAVLELERRRLAVHLALEREARARTAGELEAARRIQTGMLPRPEKVLASERRVELFAHMRPAREVGGDLYDFFLLDGRRLFAVVGDVAGKGLAAALFMAVSKALTKSSSLRGPGNVGQLLETINIELARDNPDDLFVTLLAVVLDLDSGQFEYCNAGHEPLLLVRNDGSVQVLDHGGGPPLCVFDYSSYSSTRMSLLPGEWLALASDGLTEAEGPGGGMFGREALKSLLGAASQAGLDSLAQAGQRVLQGVSDFEAGIDPADDQTLLLLRWRGPGARAF